MTKPEELKKTIFDQLHQIRDPGTATDVVQMRIIKSLTINNEGKVQLVIKPTSSVCPLVAKLMTTIKTIIEDIDGVTGVKMTVINHIQADMLNQLINE